MSGSWGVAAGIAGSILGALALLGSGLFAARATKAAALTTAEAQRTAANVAAEPAQRAQDLAAFREIREGLDRRIGQQDRKIEEQTQRIDTMSALLRAYSWTVEKLIGRMRERGNAPESDDIHDLVREHMRTGV
ncbi:MAG: hypothetical protein HOV73_18365 [Streptomyces sp.]|nr:hypothetical protein [Streptomyces sp.]NUS24865.1 hypothetical protein [Streptomyces sp.]NUS25595.1 hypothetical protein [Streptomyces sp.]NUS76577.1 hypothetical protein [Streptomyces sp.]